MSLNFRLTLLTLTCLAAPVTAFAAQDNKQPLADEVETPDPLLQKSDKVYGDDHIVIQKEGPQDMEDNAPDALERSVQKKEKTSGVKEQQIFKDEPSATQGKGKATKEKKDDRLTTPDSLLDNM